MTRLDRGFKAGAVARLMSFAPLDPAVCFR